MTPSGGADPVEKSLRRRFRCVETDVVVGDRTISVLHPESAEDLIDERDFERDERLPYWAELWPSSRVLAEHVLALQGSGRSLLELGCGAGVVTICASFAGFEVVASDYYEDALRFTRVNAARNGAPAPETMLLDWRHLPPDLRRFDVVVASDVLYERSYGPVLARVVSATLADRGTAIVADPGRVGREAFLQSFVKNGLAMRKRTECPFEEGVIQQTITKFEIERST